jgi:propanediol dehydratase small subunit
MSFEPNVEWMNISEPNNLLGPPDGKYAKIGSNQLWDDFSGYLVFTNPENWTELTTITTTTTVLTDFVIENISVTPETLRRDGTVTNLMVALELPEGIAADQISEEPLVILPGNVKANNQIVSEIAGRTVLVAMFDRAELMDAIDDYGQVRLTVLGTLTSGQTFSGDITITITRFAGN